MQVTFDEVAKRLPEDTDMLLELIDHRGGCACFVSPPCSACSEPLTVDEAIELGWMEDEPATAVQPDYMKAVRDMCR